MSISAFEAELDPEKFVRIHRCTIINSDRVRWVQPWNHGRNYQVILQDGTRLVLSRKQTLRKLTGNSFSESRSTSLHILIPQRHKDVLWFQIQNYVPVSKREFFRNKQPVFRNELYSFDKLPHFIPGTKY